MSHVDPDERVRRALGFLAAGEAARARRQCEKALALTPGHFDARHLLGVMALRAGRPHEALRQLTKAVRLAPEEAQVRSNLAAALRLAGRFPEAEAEARQAVEREPDRGEYVANLAQTLGDLGRWEEALVLFRRAAELAPALGGLHYDIGRTLNRLERYPEAERALRDALAAVPAHRGAAVELGLVLTGQQRQAEAVVWYEGWLTHDPEVHGVLFNLGQLYAEQDRHAEALAMFERAARLAPRDAPGLGMLALEYEHLNRLDRAEKFARSALKQAPDLPAPRLALARCLRRRGEFEPALALLEGVCTSGWLEVALGNERARLLDGLGRYAEAWRAFAHTNTVAVAQGTVDPDEYLRFTSRHESLYTPEFVACVRALPLPEDTLGFVPVFHFGFPRSGTTLTDQVLGGHSQVAVLEEKGMLDAVRAALHERGLASPQGLAGLDVELRTALRAAYREAVIRVLGERGVAPVVVDKMPLYTVQAGVIACLFPEARIVFSLRHPYDVCLSCLMQNFVDNPAMANFRDARRTVVLYERVMSLWMRLRASFALTVYTNRYEDLVRDPTRGARALAEFLGLAFDPAMLDSAGRAQQQARIRTASYAQVVNPINQAALGRFQHYLPYLLPTFRHLDRFVSEFGYAPVDDSVEASS